MLHVDTGAYRVMFTGDFDTRDSPPWPVLNLKMWTFFSSKAPTVADHIPTKRKSSNVSSLASTKWLLAEGPR